MDRIEYAKVKPPAFQAMLALSSYVRKGGLEPHLIHLVDLRVSQMNGCAYCVDMHDKDLRAAGETPERLALLPVWREAHNFTARERAALAWAEAVTTLGAHGVPDDVYAAARAALGDEHLVELTLAVATINAWNRLNVAFRTPSGQYQPAAR